MRRGEAQASEGRIRARTRRCRCRLAYAARSRERPIFTMQRPLGSVLSLALATISLRCPTRWALLEVYAKPQERPDLTPHWPDRDAREPATHASGAPISPK